MTEANTLCEITVRFVDHIEGEYTAKQVGGVVYVDVTKLNASKPQRQVNEMGRILQSELRMARILGREY